MIQAKTIENIQESCRQRYDEGEQRIVAIIIARYTNHSCKQMIQENYTFWHYWTGKALDFFWLGYGSYNFHLEEHQSLVGDYSDEPHVFFDTEAFCAGIAELERLANIKYNDSIGILLCNYKNNTICLSESAYIDIKSLIIDEKHYKLRDFASSLIKACKKKHNVTDVIWELRVKKASYGLLDLKLSDIVSDGIKAMLGYCFGFIN